MSLGAGSGDSSSSQRASCVERLVWGGLSEGALGYDPGQSASGGYNTHIEECERAGNAYLNLPPQACVSSCVLYDLKVDNCLSYPGP